MTTTKVFIKGRTIDALVELVDGEWTIQPFTKDGAYADDEWWHIDATTKTDAIQQARAWCQHHTTLRD